MSFFLLYVCLVVMNLYVATKVPVTLGFNAMVIPSGDGSITAMGTWSDSESSVDGRMDTPLQTSRIACSRALGRCFEARASVYENLLRSDIFEYDIEKWDDTTIVFVSEDLCVTTRYTIDLIAKTTNGIAMPARSDTAICAADSGQQVTRRFHLSNGFPVYWRERSNARPIPMRVIQAMFGN